MEPAVPQAVKFWRPVWKKFDSRFSRKLVSPKRLIPFCETAAPGEFGGPPPADHAIFGGSAAPVTSGDGAARAKVARESIEMIRVFAMVVYNDLDCSVLELTVELTIPQSSRERPLLSERIQRARGTGGL